MANAIEPALDRIVVKDDSVVVATFLHVPYVMKFVLNDGQWGLPTSLAKVMIEQPGQTLVIYHSPYQHPVSYRPFGFVESTPHWTPGEFARYWEATSEKVRRRQKRGELLNAWQILRLGARDLRLIKEGHYAMDRKTS